MASPGGGLAAYCVWFNLQSAERALAVARDIATSADIELLVAEQSEHGLTAYQSGCVPGIWKPGCMRRRGTTLVAPIYLPPRETESSRCIGVLNINHLSAHALDQLADQVWAEVCPARIGEAYATFSAHRDRSQHALLPPKLSRDDLKRPVALKVMNVIGGAREEVAKRFLREARIAAGFHHAKGSLARSGVADAADSCGSGELGPAQAGTCSAARGWNFRAHALAWLVLRQFQGYDRVMIVRPGRRAMRDLFRSYTRAGFVLYMFVLLVACAAKDVSPSDTEDECLQNTDCVMVVRGCCAGCLPPTREQVLAVPKSEREAAQREQCPDPVSCGPCYVTDPEPLAPLLVAACVAKRCELVDLREEAISSCTSDSDCVAVGRGCCPPSSADPVEYVGLQKDASTDLLACFPIPPCIPPLPHELPIAYCAADGHCAVRRRETSDGEPSAECYSPTQNLDQAYEPDAIGCDCQPGSLAICRADSEGVEVALVCQDNEHWQSAEDGPCAP